MNELVKEERSWWSRNWKWVVPVGGCFTIIIIGIILIGGAIFGFVNKVQNSSGGDEALEIVQNNPAVIEALGEPIEKNGFGSYKVNYTNGDKTAEALFPIKGPKGEALVELKSAGEDDEILYEIFQVTLENTGEVIDLNKSQLKAGDY
ncbi:cytochrome c oxidase assembly factor Coa1 family protein [Leeuwenhoekiella sp. W20_SRS_FM14]|uniref:cytochrome c oxidase assembly factor Coa1 family protein n=1 Tax=Leeuwenhoekiella sp. W20_SRS_FM14 TaxID=3240270 RepID=UPI003F996B86